MSNQQLSQLAAMRDDGLITDDGAAAQMHEILPSPYWITDLADAPDELRDRAEALWPDHTIWAPFFVDPCDPSRQELDEFCGQPEFREYGTGGYVEYGGCIGRDYPLTADCQYLLAGMIGGRAIATVSGGLVLPAHDGIDLPLPGGDLVRIEIVEIGIAGITGEVLRVARIHDDRDETQFGLRGPFQLGHLNVVGNLGELVLRASGTQKIEDDDDEIGATEYRADVAQELRAYTDDDLRDIITEAAQETGQDAEWLGLVSDEITRRECVDDGTPPS